ncbi:MAG: DUF2267 domain-containing protein [Desulfobulbaceae bacterium]|nr:DUF2267 domain-containing protein [Desulfobulbaceae bacterium]
MNKAEHIIFDHSVTKADSWIREFMAETGIDDFIRAKRLFCAILKTLRDRLPVNHARQLASQLPLVMAEVYMQGYRVTECPIQTENLDEFLDHMKKYINFAQGYGGEKSVKAVYTVLCRKIKGPEIKNIDNIMPVELSGRNYGTPTRAL